MVVHPAVALHRLRRHEHSVRVRLAALISGQLDDAWIASVRKWTLGAWFSCRWA